MRSAMRALSLTMKAPIRRFSVTVRRAKIRRPSGTWTMPLAMISWAGNFARSSPSRRIRPLCGRTSPLIELRVVLLPAPLPPIRATISPFPTSRLIPRRAWMLP